MCEDPLAGPLPLPARPSPGAFPPRRCAATGSGLAWKGSGRRWLALLHGGELYSASRLDLAASLGPWTKCSLRPLSLRGGTGPPAPGAAVNLGGLSSVRPDRVASLGRGSAHVQRRQGSAAMSATHPTRLETRTKESNARASQRVPNETPWRNESEGRRAPSEVGSRPRGVGRTTGPSRPHRRGGG